jgi:hypothetical protein
MLSGIPKSAMCVRKFDDSRDSAIHITYRISLRSSSLREPRDPLLKVVFYFKHFFCSNEGTDKDQALFEYMVTIKKSATPSWINPSGELLLDAEALYLQHTVAPITLL